MMRLQGAHGREERQSEGGDGEWRVGLGFGMVESEWSKVECKRAAHRALSESVVSVMSLRRERVERRC